MPWETRHRDWGRQYPLCTFTSLLLSLWLACGVGTPLAGAAFVAVFPPHNCFPWPTDVFCGSASDGGALARGVWVSFQRQVLVVPSLEFSEGSDPPPSLIEKLCAGDEQTELHFPSNLPYFVIFFHVALFFWHFFSVFCWFLFFPAWLMIVFGYLWSRISLFFFEMCTTSRGFSPGMAANLKKWCFHFFWTWKEALFLQHVQVEYRKFVCLLLVWKKSIFSPSLKLQCHLQCTKVIFIFPQNKTKVDTMVKRNESMQKKN